VQLITHLTGEIPERIENRYHDRLKSSGIYFLFDDDLLIYIGRSINIKRRLMQHHVFKEHYQIWCIFISNPFRLEATERFLIQLIQPIENQYDVFYRFKR
jgi:hypothetical protein